MRDWNQVAQELSTFDPVEVFSLPMRDWNFGVLAVVGMLITMFLAYLWGIETVARAFTRQGLPLFLAYLWGIET